jgi:N-acyl-D-amino-acid deacylase
MISTVIAGATIADGTGRPRFVTDVALIEDRIAKIGSCEGVECVERIDGAGFILAPGFVDACSHTDDGWLSLAALTSSTAQGFTAEITGLCGVSAFDPAVREREPAVTRRSFAVPGPGLREACEAGALGVSMDLGSISPVAALAAARDACAGGAPRIAAHLRSYGRELFEALDEAIDLAARSGAALHLSHLHARQHGAPIRLERALERIDRARSSGIAVTCDVYPYVATWIDLAALLSPTIALETLDDERFAAAAALEMEARIGDAWSELMLSEVSNERDYAWCGMRFDEIGRQMRLRPARAIVEFVRRNGLRARAFWFCLREDDVATALSAAFCAVGTAAAACSFHDERFGLVHPRTFGTAPRIFGRFVHQRHTLTLEDAVHRMTSFAARTFGLDGHGELSEGSRADLVLFSEHGFVDTATYERPVSRPVGLKHLWIAGHRKGA